MSGNSAKPYHHGDIPRAAIEAALSALETTGAEKLSLRQLAEDIGVTHRALYRHFDGRAGLLQALVARGFALFQSALQDTDETPASFVAAYTRFALARPHLYALMMTAPPLTRTGEIIAVQQPVIAWMQRSFGSDEAAIRAWMILHGGLSLAKAGMLQDRNPERLEAFLLKLVVQA